MIRSNRLGMYQDVREVLDAALAAGGGAYECETHGQAVHWRQRAYRFRKLYAEQYGGVSPYDALVLPRCDDATVYINLRKQVGVFKPANKMPEPEPMFESDPLLDAAELFARKLGDI